jgi:D-alanyl-D-alanine carboxypeptidase-like protein
MATSLRSLRADFRPFAEELLRFAASQGLSPRVTSARRSRREQGYLYRRFLAGQSEFPVAPPGTSAHEVGMAFDLVLPDPGDLSFLGRRWEEMGGVWGGHFQDPIHFEAPGFSHSARGIASEFLSAAETGASLLIPTPVSLIGYAERYLFPSVARAHLKYGSKLARSVGIPQAWIDLAARITGLEGS